MGGEDFVGVGGNVARLLRRLEHEGLQRIRMFTTVCLVYVVFWGPLFMAVVFGGQSGAQNQSEGRGLASVGPPKDPISHQVTLYICFAHAFVNPTLLLSLHSGLRHQAASIGSIICCCCCCCFPLANSSSPENSSPDRAAGFSRPTLPPPIPDHIDYGRIINYNGVPSFLSPLPVHLYRANNHHNQSRPM